MCGLCGVLACARRGGAPEPTLLQASGSAAARRQERHRRVRLLNQVLRQYGLGVEDFAGTALVLRNRTGRSEIVASVAALWPAAERLSGKPCDPFEPALLATLDGAAREGGGA